ncbi:hypothetical protein QJS10_CPB12g00088 [Acorus calamus]|uniref:Uncharacterized protein n=1 Tax=Acorus calamus TaxID=4465 RepID=A0AAV9DNU8_ACOCL|nr:hypothetical protein QJS10_CPB12g00088 [Acorus calamus]
MGTDAAKERKLQTISIINDKARNPETIEELKALGGDIVVPESYTKTWEKQKLSNLEGQLKKSEAAQRHRMKVEMAAREIQKHYLVEK